MNRRFDPRTLAFLGMMTALVFASNYARIIMPIAIGGRTSFTLANIVCVLSGLLLGPIGGLASGLGSALYDLTNPLYAAECWITFLTKGVMGLVAGLLVRRQAREGELSYARCLAGAVCGCLAYYVLYFAKSFFYDGLLVEGLQPGVALAALPRPPPAPPRMPVRPGPHFEHCRGSSGRKRARSLYPHRFAPGCGAHVPPPWATRRHPPPPARAAPAVRRPLPDERGRRCLDSIFLNRAESNSHFSYVRL